MAPIEIDGIHGFFPLKMVIFHGYVSHNQMLIQSDVAMDQNPDTLGHSCFDIKLALGLTK